MNAARTATRSSSARFEEDVPYRKIAEITGVTYGRIGQIAMVNKARTAQL